MDISNLLERAKAFSEGEMTQDEEENLKASEESQDRELNAVMQAVKIAKMLNEINIANNAAKGEKDISQLSEEQEETNKTYNFDTDTQTPAIRTIKAAIPYLDREYQKNIGIMVKIIELDNLIKRYTTETMSINRKKGWQKEMLISMKPELDKRKRHYIDMIVNFINIKEIMEIIREEEENETENREIV